MPDPPVQPITPVVIPANPLTPTVAPSGQPAATPAPVVTPTQETTPLASISATPVATAQPATSGIGHNTPANTATLPEAPVSKSGMTKGAKYAIIGILTLVFAITAVVFLSVKNDRDETAEVNEVLAQAKELNDAGKLQDGIELNLQQLKGVLNRTTSAQETKNRSLLLKTLAYTRAKGSYDVNDVILNHVIKTRTRPSIRTDIFKSVMARRKAVANITPLLEFAKTTKDHDSAAAAIEAARASAIGQPADDYINDFLILINDTDSATVRGAAERAAADLISQSEAKESFVNPIHGTFESALQDSSKFAMLRLLGATGGDKAAKTVGEILKSKNANSVNAALAALGKWSDDSQFDTLVDFIETTENSKLRAKAFDATYAFLLRDRKRDSEDLADMWKAFAGTATTQKEKLQVIRGMANQKHEWAISVLEFFIEDQDDKVIDKAERAKEFVERRLRELGGE